MVSTPLVASHQVLRQPRCFKTTEMFWGPMEPHRVFRSANGAIHTMRTSTYHCDSANGLDVCLITMSSHQRLGQPNVASAGVTIPDGKYTNISNQWAFPKIEVPEKGLFIMESHGNSWMDDLPILLFRKHPYVKPPSRPPFCAFCCEALRHNAVAPGGVADGWNW